VVDTSAEQMSRHAVELGGDNGLIIVEDSMARFAIAYQILHSGAAEIDMCLWPRTQPEAQAALLETAHRHAAGGGTVILVPLDRDAQEAPPPTGVWERKGDLYVLDSRSVPAGVGTLPE